RDPKGLYKKARAGEIKHFTGIDSEYQAPISPEIHIKTAELSVEACADQVIQALTEKEYI
ncbi:adenylyl-sulfate kinase, partial [Vibrio parahaemolyticus]|nr:adenylyl-sulfate kinase [Vibrio parahaemolyticus]